MTLSHTSPRPSRLRQPSQSYKHARSQERCRLIPPLGLSCSNVHSRSPQHPLVTVTLLPRARQLMFRSLSPVATGHWPFFPAKTDSLVTKNLQRSVRRGFATSYVITMPLPNLEPARDVLHWTNSSHTSCEPRVWPRPRFFTPCVSLKSFRTRVRIYL